MWKLIFSTFREIVEYIKKRNVQEFEEQRINLEQKNSIKFELITKINTRYNNKSE